MNFAQAHRELESNGFAVINDIFDDEAIASIINVIEKADTSRDTFRKSDGLFAIRQFFMEFPSLVPEIFSGRLRAIIGECAGSGYFIVKSIYFDKPEQSNWYVACHQDLTISVKERFTVDGYSRWTVKQGQFAVQPPAPVLGNITTLRLHLDDTDANNGALYVVPGTHRNGVIRPEAIDRIGEVVCPVRKGGIMLMKPLLLHSSRRSLNNARRRVIHIELASVELPGSMEWAEKMQF